MATFTWNTTTGLFSSAGNWTPSGPPGATDTAVFGSGSGTISGNGTVGTLQLNPTGTWTWSGVVTANNFAVNDTDTLTTGARWTLAGTPTNNNVIVIGSGSGGSGTLTVSNGATITSTQPASTSTYSLNVGSGSFANARGALTVTGPGSSVNMGANGASVGYAGTGVLSIQAGGAATFTSSDSSQIAALGTGFKGNGTVNVDGSGSSLTASGFVYFGRGGTGAMTVSSGATFTGGSAATGSASAYGIDFGDGTGASATTEAFGGTGAGQVVTGGTLHSLAYLDIGYNGSTGSLTVDGAGSLVTADTTVGVGGGSVRTGGKGSLAVQNGGTLRAGTPGNGNAGVAIGGGQSGVTGSVIVTGAGSLLDANGYRITVGTYTTGTGVTAGGTGSLTISDGAHVLSGASYSDTEAALAVGGAPGSSGTITITGNGSKLTASGAAVIGGNNLGAGITVGGTGTVTVVGGGQLQTGAMTIEAGSSLSVDQSSTLTTPSLTINGGTADLGTLSAATAIGFGNGGMLRLHSVSGSNAIGSFAFGDQIDFVNNVGVSLSGNTITAGGGTITLGAAPANASYQLASDGSGGTTVSLTPQTIGVYRFFESNGTHFYTSSQTEAAGLANPSSPSFRPDLVEETNGFGAYAQVASDPNEVQIFRFFDATHGTEFLTASATEAKGLMDATSTTYRPDLTFEPTSSFYEHSTQQPGDAAVYRFFDTNNGTHFYTGSQSEYSSITTAGSAGYRADLTYEGVGFYAPAGTYST